MIQLLNLVDEEDQDTFLYLYENAFHILIRQANSIVGEIHDAEEVVQDTFLAVAKLYSRLGMRNWTYERQLEYCIAAVRNNAVSLLRSRLVKQKSAKKLEKSCIDLVCPDIAQEYERRDEVHRKAVDILDELTDEEIHILCLQVYFGFKKKEIAAMIGKSPNAIYKIVHYLRKRINGADKSRKQRRKIKKIIKDIFANSFAVVISFDTKKYPVLENRRDKLLDAFHESKAIHQKYLVHRNRILLLIIAIISLLSLAFHKQIEAFIVYLHDGYGKIIIYQGEIPDWEPSVSDGYFTVPDNFELIVQENEENGWMGYYQYLTPQGLVTITMELEPTVKNFTIEQAKKIEVDIEGISIFEMENEDTNSSESIYIAYNDRYIMTIVGTIEESEATEIMQSMNDRR